MWVGQGCRRKFSGPEIKESRTGLGSELNMAEVIEATLLTSFRDMNKLCDFSKTILPFVKQRKRYLLHRVVEGK